MRRHAMAVVASAAVATLLAACGGAGDGAGGDATGAATDAAAEGGELTPVTVGVIPIVDVAPIYLGVDQGFFEEEGLDVTLELAQGGAAIVPAVLNGQYQFGFSNVTSLLLAAQEGVPLKAVAPGNFTTGKVGEDFAAIVAPGESDIASAADLVGKTVAVNTLNNIGDSTVRKVVEDDGGDPSGVEFVEMGFPDMPAALSGGQVDAAWILEPHLTRALDAGAKVVSWNYAEVDPDLMIAAYFTSEQFLSSDAETVQAFQAALTRSFEYAQENPDDTRAILDEYTEIDPAVKEAMVMPRFETELSEDSMQLLADLAMEYGLTDEEIDVSTLLP